MATFTKSDRLDALRFARRLADLAKDAPNSYSQRCVYSAVNAIRKTFGFSDSDKKTLLLHLIGQGCSCYDDLVNETSIHKSEIVRIVQLLSNDDSVRIITLNGGSRGGRPTVFLQKAS